uniref:Uncharacterized protein n=1 Tax=Ralstonia solanacearum TaxID=305 RepID=A0A0S4URR9_RALSL|nr:protein of unknown function [Ralstonia solanacearum]
MAERTHFCVPRYGDEAGGKRKVSSRLRASARA